MQANFLLNLKNAENTHELAGNVLALTSPDAAGRSRWARESLPHAFRANSLDQECHTCKTLERVVDSGPDLIVNIPGLGRRCIV